MSHYIKCLPDSSPCCIRDQPSAMTMRCPASRQTLEGILMEVGAAKPQPWSGGAPWIWKEGKGCLPFKWCLLYVSLGPATSGGSWVLLLALGSVVTPGRVQGTQAMPRIEPGSVRARQVPFSWTISIAPFERGALAILKQTD